MPSRFEVAPGAVSTVKRVAKPALVRAGDRIGPAIVAAVPVHHGVAVRTYRPEVDVAGDEVHVRGFGPFWHLLEYGTAYSAAYRPIERGVRAAGLKFEAQ